MSDHPDLDLTDHPHLYLSDLDRYITWAKGGIIDLNDLRQMLVALTEYEKSWRAAFSKLMRDCPDWPGPRGRDLTDLHRYITWAKEGLIDLNDLRRTVASMTAYEKSWRAALSTPEWAGRATSIMWSRNADNVAHYRRIMEEMIQQQSSTAPKGFAMLLACLARPGRADEVLGDAEDEFRKVIARLGVSRARWVYRRYIIRTVFGMLPAAVIRLLVLRKLFNLF